MITYIIVQGKPNPDFNQKRIIFGSYGIFYIGTKNTMKRGGVPAIFISELNEHGVNYLMNLYTGKRFHSYEW